VLERQGQRYRNALQARAQRLGVHAQVRFDDRYLASPDLRRLVRQSDVVLLPYDSTDQVTSGVLIEAITAGKPVVSTGFPHARELLASGAGLVVRRQDPSAIAAALRRVLTEPGLGAMMAAEASRIAPELLWPAVAEQYRRSAIDALRAATVLATA
jgi:glycosyltransferase involved in cell wall biosynthesis